MPLAVVLLIPSLRIVWWPHNLLVHMGTGNAAVFNFMAELFQCFLDIPRHREVDLSSIVVPIKGNAYVPISGPIAC